MKAAHRDRPVRDFAVPKGVVFKRIDPKTGALIPPWAEGGIFEVFKKGTEPKEKEPLLSESGRFFELDNGKVVQ